MSRDIFGEELQGEHEEREPYIPGTHRYNPTIIDEMIRAFVETDEEVWHNQNILLAEFSGQLKMMEDFDAQTLLEDAVQRYPEAVPERHTYDADLFLNPLLEMLYTLGHNDLKVDLSSSPLEMNSNNFPWQLSGTKDNSWKLTYIPPKDSYRSSSMMYFGDELSYVHLHTIGDKYTVGYGSKNCDFTIEGDVEMIGMAARNCTYRFPLASRASIETVAEWEWEKDKSILYRLHMTHKYNVEVDVASGFFERGNIILIPDGNGGWSEVSQ